MKQSIISEIVDKYRSGELNEERDVRGAGGVWDLAKEIAKTLYGNSTNYRETAFMVNLQVRLYWLLLDEIKKNI